MDLRSDEFGQFPRRGQTEDAVKRTNRTLQRFYLMQMI